MSPASIYIVLVVAGRKPFNVRVWVTWKTLQYWGLKLQYLLPMLKRFDIEVHCFKFDTYIRIIWYWFCNYCILCPTSKVQYNIEVINLQNTGDWDIIHDIKYFGYQTIFILYLISFQTYDTEDKTLISKVKFQTSILKLQFWYWRLSECFNIKAATLVLKV